MPPAHTQPLRRAMLAGALAATVPLSPIARAQEARYPSRPVQLIVPWATGGGADTLSRTLAPALADELGQPVVVENRPGAGGNIGAAQAAQARPDGYTVLIATAATHAINPGLYPTMPFRAEDFASVTRLVMITNILVVNPSVPAKDVRELIALSRTAPLNYASAGNGSTQHLSAEMFKIRTGAAMTHVPYKGGGPAVMATIGGETQVLFADPLAAGPSIRAGRLRPLAVTGQRRLASMPELPTVEEAGVPGFVAINWTGVMVPAGTPVAVVERLNAAFNAVLARPAIRERLAEQGYEASGSSADVFDRMVREETQRWGEIIRTAKARVD